MAVGRISLSTTFATRLAHQKHTVLKQLTSSTFSPQAIPTPRIAFIFFHVPDIPFPQRSILPDGTRPWHATRTSPRPSVATRTAWCIACWAPRRALRSCRRSIGIRRPPFWGEPLFFKKGFFRVCWLRFRMFLWFGVAFWCLCSFWFWGCLFLSGSFRWSSWWSMVQWTLDCNFLQSKHSGSACWLEFFRTVSFGFAKRARPINTRGWHFCVGEEMEMFCWGAKKDSWIGWCR